MPLDNSTPSQPPSQPWDKSYPTDLRWDAEIPEITMVDLFDEAVKKYKDRPCLDFMGKKLSYQEVGDMVDRFAKGLQDQGIGKGSKVGLSLPNTPFYVVAYYGAMKAGATVANFNPLYAEHEMENQIRDSDVDVMVTLNLQDMYPKIERMLGQANLKKIVVCNLADALPGMKSIALNEGNKHYGTVSKLAWLANKSPLKIPPMKAILELHKEVGKQRFAKIKKNRNILSFDKLTKTKGKLKPVALHPDDLAVLQYTGGTTGVPKAAMLTQGNLSANTQQATLWFTAGKERPQQDKILAVLPFFHSFGMIAQMSLGLSTGSEILLVPRFEIKSLLKTINDEKPTIFAGVPTIYKAITDHETVGNYDLSSLEVCISGAAPLSNETMQAFKNLTGIELVEGYGLSESSAAATANPVNGLKKTGSIGLPLPGTEVKLVPQDAELPVKLPGADVPVVVQGEICLRGPQIMKGYWKRDDETALVLDKDGWLHTGDIGRFDDDGYLNIVGRIKDMIIASGLKVFPRKVEEALLKHDAIDDAAVIGVKDEYRGENVKAFIVLKKGKTLTAQELDIFLKGLLASYEVPKLVEFRDTLPLTMIGKPDKKELKRQEAEKDAQQQAPQPPKKNGGPKL